MRSAAGASASSAALHTAAEDCGGATARAIHCACGAAVVAAHACRATVSTPRTVAAGRSDVRWTVRFRGGGDGGEGKRALPSAHHQAVEVAAAAGAAAASSRALSSSGAKARPTAWCVACSHGVS